MRSVAAHGGRWLWVPEEETDDSREGQVWGPACMPGVWVAYVNPGKPSTNPLQALSTRPSEWSVLSRVFSVFAVSYFGDQTTLSFSHVSYSRQQQVAHVNSVEKMCLYRYTSCLNVFTSHSRETEKLIWEARIGHLAITSGFVATKKAGKCPHRYVKSIQI